MEKIIKGVVRYTKNSRLELLKEFQRIRDNPQPTGILFTCVDSRLCPLTFTSANIGDMFVVRNAGNFIPNSEGDNPELMCERITNEPGALELACVRSKIKDVVICGHSDCKAMTLLFGKKEDLNDMSNVSPLEMWLKKHGQATIDKYNQLLATGSKGGPITFNDGLSDFDAYIDPENKFDAVDKFSQVNCLQQLDNASSYGFVKDGVQSGDVHLHAMWFDVYDGHVYMFDRKKKYFKKIEEEEDAADC